MLSGGKIIHSIHHHNCSKESKSSPLNLKSTALLFGLVRGLPPCLFKMEMWLWATSMGNMVTGTLSVFIFGLGAAVGLISLGIVMGGIARAAKRTRYGNLIPKISKIATMAIGLILILGLNI
ncbi:MAG: urease accessory protein UreH domain-containing protein [Thermoproteota archaeon]